MADEKPNVDVAYGVSSPDDNRRLYASWAETYDSDFAVTQAYELPFHTAQVFFHAGGRGPVLDIGAGTGLCGAALAKLGVGPIDGTDISREMLDVALRKDIYRDVFEADVLQGLPVKEGHYLGIVSSGTFTHGHVGPEALPELVRVIRPGGLIAISINSAHFENRGFQDMLQDLAAMITDVSLTEVAIYGSHNTGSHAHDRALVACFTKR